MNGVDNALFGVLAVADCVVKSNVSKLLHE